MALTTQSIREVAALFAGAGHSGLGTQAVRAAASATDTWIADNQAAFNAALPEPFKSSATAVQKTLLFCYVAVARTGGS